MDAAMPRSHKRTPKPPATEIRPQPAQWEFLSTPADIAIFGGAAGGGKSWSLLTEPLRHIKNPDFGAVIFRRTHPQIVLEGGLLDESARVYGAFGGALNKSALRWLFPSGASITLDAMQYESNVYDWQGSQVPLIEWDEMTHFTAKQFWYMLSRNRSTCGVRHYIRASCNPDPDSFVAELIAWWIDQETGYPIPERGGKLRYFYRLADQMHWYDSPEEAMFTHPDMAKDAPPKSLTFIPSRLEDNAVLMQRDPGYLANLKSLTLVDMERLLKGNWKVRPAAGKVFNRGWFEIVDAVPAGGTEVRGWDFAATERKINKPDPDFTAGVLMRRVGDTYFVMDCEDFQEGPTEVETRFKNISQQDHQRAAAGNVQYRVRFEVEPGSAAKRDAMRLIGMLAGVDVRGIDARGDKVTRAAPLAAQARAGNIKVLRGAWNERFLKHMHAFPEGAHDDIADAVASAFNELTEWWVPEAESGPAMW